MVRIEQGGEYTAKRFRSGTGDKGDWELVVVKAEGKGTAYISTTYNGVTYQCIVRCNIK